MATIGFGSGGLFAVRTDISPATPLPVGVLTDVTLDFKGDIKKLYGQNQFPVAVARGKVDVSIKAKSGQISGQLFNTLFFGQAMTTGQVALAYNEPGTVSASSPYQVNVSNAATFGSDFGVIYALTGLPLIKVASAPAAGQYAVSAGVYTFAAADEGKGVLINYTYAISASGQQFTMNNSLMGTQPVVMASLYGFNEGKPSNLIFYQCVSSSLSMAIKNDDFTMNDIELDVFANAANQVFTWSFAEAS